MENRVRLGDILLIKEFSGISNYPCIYEPPITGQGQQDANNGKLLIAFSKDGNKNRFKQVGLYRVADEVTYLCHMTEYFETNMDAIKKVKAFGDVMSVEMTSLQTIQLIEINKVTQNLGEAFRRLHAIYEEIFTQNETAHTERSA